LDSKSHVDESLAHRGRFVDTVEYRHYDSFRLTKHKTEGTNAREEEEEGPEAKACCQKDQEEDGEEEEVASQHFVLA
jgi:hypothetical protein